MVSGITLRENLCQNDKFKLWLLIFWLVHTNFLRHSDKDNSLSLQSKYSRKGFHLRIHQLLESTSHFQENFPFCVHFQRNIFLIFFKLQKIMIVLLIFLLIVSQMEFRSTHNQKKTITIIVYYFQLEMAYESISLSVQMQVYKRPFPLCFLCMSGLVQTGKKYIHFPRNSGLSAKWRPN